MPHLLTQQGLRSFFDANPARYKTGSVDWPLLPDGYLSSEGLAYLLHTPHAMVPNPVATPAQVPAPFTAVQILGSVTTGDALKVVGAPMVTKLLDAILAQDRAACTAWASLCVAANYITAAEETGIRTILNATMADPSWTAQVAAPCDLAVNFVDALGRTVTRLELALNAAGGKLCRRAVDFINAALGRD